ncbi:ATP-binding protein [Nonomuraea wenchangensis]|uniref:biotin carboxylase n=1 Tax=Nonomuraea wenchangensis TaxID=568860 RepID=A0A1I0LBV1_9ACTN|nr:biotin carboxylase N-terminal domain-containing protein [Nonomuraea wenchangensis]SEU37505.1 3-methylcrotonyl-CoA carboxylase alpha subunit/acetyl-CoA/propionyl-CoA carboxylase, biotin carboxylase, biotin carboxyl carrier protein [Nonomuraea wenchangensis]
MTSIGTLLVANRGEIALRVIRAARRMGLRTVAVYSDADRRAPHVRAADTAVRIGPAPAAASYLDIDAVIGAARRTGADAIHPGYGFLSERAAFARAVTEAGLTFVGPSAEVMELMGRKDAARQVAIDAGVPVVPSVELTAGQAAGSQVRFPVLVKAAAGGGGKGMRIVREPADLAGAVEAARREAASAFGDDAILIERYVEHGRHVEVQVLADHYGNVVHLFERDCSAQRRHQKVIEEAPAPTVSAGVRRVLTDSAVALAKKVGYANAGTVEFLVSGEEVFFLEMNTRLQVEHPVTELVTGLDLVELQLRVAAGEPLPFTQDDVTVTGHAFEARVYAEDAFHGFLPQAGVAELVRWPARSRVDAALESGQEVTTFYDPMLGKVIVHGPDREVARRALVAALDDTAILGLTTNVGFLRGLAGCDAFRDCEVDTAWLDRNPEAIRPAGLETARVFAAWALAGMGGGQAGGQADGQAGGQAGHPFGVADGWRLGGPAAPTPVELSVDGDRTLFLVHRSGRVTCDGAEWSVRPVAADGEVLRLEIDGLVREGTVRTHRDAVQVAHLGSTFTFERPDASGTGGSAVTGDGTVLAPMPGTVLVVAVEAGQAVEEGAVLGVMEAMKMELTLRAPMAGTVTRVGAAAGDQVPLGAPLFVVEGS